MQPTKTQDAGVAPQRVRRKVFTGEAMRIVGYTDLGRIRDWVYAGGGNLGVYQQDPGPVFAMIETPQGSLRADIGDWIVMHSLGEFYPYKPWTFAVLFEPLGSSE